MSDPHVTAVCGSLREESHTRPALVRVLSAAEARGAETDLVDLRELDVPIFDADEREPGDVPALTRRVRAADAIVLGTPMYHGSYSSSLKTAIDYCGFDEFEHKTVGLLGVSGGSFPITALEHLRSVCRALNAWVLPYQAAIPNASRHFEGRELTNADLAERVDTLGEQMVQYADLHREPSSLESEQNVGAD